MVLRAEVSSPIGFIILTKFLSQESSSIPILSNILSFEKEYV